MDFQMWWMLFLWALSSTDRLAEATGGDTANISDTVAEENVRHNDKYPDLDYPYIRGNGNAIRDDYPEERLPPPYSKRCTDRLEDALQQVRRRQRNSNQKTLRLNGYTLHQQLRAVPYDMYVTDMRVRMPSSDSWVRVDRCFFDPRNSSLETRLLFSDLTISGRVNMLSEGELQREPLGPDPEASCNMVLRLRRAGIGFHTEPIRLERGQFNVRTDSHFLEPGFISVYAYGCEPRRYRDHRREFREEEDDVLSKEMEDVFLKGIRSLLTSYMQKELQPAIKETLMKNLGYTVSYG